MNYVVTARKWRPLRFEEVVGQEHITTTLINAIKNNRVAHAFIFAGPRGVGKTTTARILAKTLNCISPVGSEPCNVCEMCQAFNSSQSMDIIEIDGASNRRIEEIRTLRESVKYAPTKGKYKVYIIDEVHMLTNESFNALLKTLEEPPEHTIFIFATTDVHKVPLTIISRCQRFDFRRIELGAIKELLKKIADEEKIVIDDLSLTLIAKKADGALRDAESIFDQIISFSGKEITSIDVLNMLNIINDDVFFQISDSVIEKNFKTAFEITGQIYSNGWSFIDFLNGLIEHFRNIMSVLATGSAALVESGELYKEKYLGYKDKFSEGDMLRILNFLNKTLQEIRYSQNQKIKIEVALCHLIGLERSSSLSNVLGLIEEVKKKGIIPEAAQVKEIEPEYRLRSDKEIPVVIKTGFDISNVIENKMDTGGDITTRWASLVSDIQQEKLFLGSALLNLPITNLNNTITIKSSDPLILDKITKDKKYLESKINQYIGPQYKFYAESVTPAPAGIAEKKVSTEENPLLNSIINELGGEEMG